MKLNPCCCSLSQGAGTIGVFQIVNGFIAVLYLVFINVARTEEQKEANIRITAEADSKFKTTMAIEITLIALTLGLGILLLFGVNYRSRTCCSVWLALMALLGISYIVVVSIAVADGSMSGWDLFIPCIAILFILYSIWVVVAFFCQDLKNYSRHHDQDGLVL